ncbi:aconitate hydratase [Chryseosolibacter indicus]|uniref:Aconitate hydratase n=1 Tax=Chryseosolibacter indicus TaxID=2782351 RepID=A0ABS5VT36_9BACT|nr:aconitate hydratase [Chryseosolibacter indicus]MBT1704039.1 aconitate hydratase [Chryseosolibacter indicus]
MEKPLNVTQKLISSHLLSGEMIPGTEIGLKIDQTLTQDATGTMVMLELEAMGLDKVKTEVSVQYVDHNLLQADFRNADDHIFLRSAAQRFGLWYSMAGNGVSHPVHMERFGIPGKTLAGSDSHTPASGAMGMLALGAGGLDVAFVMLGQPLYIKMPKVLGVKLTGKLPDWISAKDVVLEMLRRYNVQGCRGMIIEYFGPGLANLTAMDRHVIANMGTEMGATTTVFPSDNEIRRFLKAQDREEDWMELVPDDGASYDLFDEINLSELEPLVALPSSPGNVVPVREVEGTSIAQVVVGSSANPGLRDFWIVSEIIKGHRINNGVSMDVNPTSRQMMENLIAMDALSSFYHAGARIHQAGCMGCIGMGQAPATGKNSLRTVPRNFPGRSGTLDDRVYLCSPETAAASALTGAITDPRTLEKRYGIQYPLFKQPEREIINTQMLLPPADDGRNLPLEKGPNIQSLPKFDRLKNNYSIPVVLKVGDNISTDEILKAGVKVLAYRSNIPEISKWAYAVIRENFYKDAKRAKEDFGGHVVVAGDNYAQGSSREHAAIAPRYLGQVAVLAKSYARLGWQNLINFGIVPLEFVNKEDYDTIEETDVIKFEHLLDVLAPGKNITAVNQTKQLQYELKHNLSERQVKVVLAGGVINYFRMPSSKPEKTEVMSDEV